MKIAITSLVTRSVSQNTFGGTEAFTFDLVERLVQKGHNVSLYAASDSQVSAKVVGVVDSQTAQKEVLGEKLSFPYYLLLARQLALDANRFDIIHNNFYNTYLFSAFASFVDKPVVHTIHNAYFHNKDWAKLMNSFGFGENEHIVFVSKHAQKIAAVSKNTHVIYNGIDSKRFAFHLSSSEYIFWMGRMVPEKGAEDAVKVALEGDFRLVMSGKIFNEAHKRYFNEFVKPFLGRNIVLEENPNTDEKVSLYQHAKAFIFPINWEEPFGLVMVEAMSCGTPVIAYARGAVPEVVKDGVTGFIVNRPDSKIQGDFIIKKTGIAGLCEAVERIYSLSNEQYQSMRKACRERVERYFTIKRMVDDYEKLYTKIVTQK